MGALRLCASFGFVVGVVLTRCLCCSGGTPCKDMPMDLCSFLSYTQTGYPNSFGHSSEDQIPLPTLSHTFRTFVTIGCYDNMELFLCAAAFPRCTSNGQLVPPCRALCLEAVSGCGYLFPYYPETFHSVDCEAMPNSTDGNVCTGPHTTSSPFSSQTSRELHSTLPGMIVNITREANTRDVTSLVATPSPWGPPTTSSSESRNTSFRNSANSTMSELKIQRSTAGSKKTITLNKMVIFGGNNKQGDFVSSMSTVTGLGIVLCVLAVAGMVVLLISCAFFRKAFGNSFRGRRKPREGAFYTNPAFDGLPQATEAPSVTPTPRYQSYTLADLPPHPAGVGCISPQPPDPYQQQPRGYTEQNLYTVSSVPKHGRQSQETDRPNRSQNNDGTAIDRPGDSAYSNGVTVDTNANEPNGKGATVAAPSTGAVSPRADATLGDDDDGDCDMVIANPTAC